MRNITYIYISLSFFVYLILSSIIYLIVKDVYTYLTNKKIEKLKGDFGEDILNQLSSIERDNKISKMEIDYIKVKLKKRLYRDIFDNTIVEYNKSSNNHKFTKIYLENFEDEVNRYVRKYSKKDNRIKTYLVVMLGEYKLSNFEISEFLFNCLTTKSIYLTASSLRAISKIGKVDNFIRALEYISDKEKNINNKILIDILDQFNGDKKVLDKKIIDKFYSLNEIIQKSLVEYFQYNKIEYVKEDMFDLLSSDITKEVKISAIKYFGTIKYDKAKNKIIKILKEEDWEFRTVCTKTLGQYKDLEITNILLESICDKNWYVRYNSAMSLLDFDDEQIIQKVIHKKDRYSIDILFYAMFIRNKISYDEYLQIAKEIEEVQLC